MQVKKNWFFYIFLRKIGSYGFPETNLDEKWLSGNIEWTMKNHKQSEQYVYINAWNEWAEGAMLEPTTRYGYKNLQTVRNVVEMFENKSAPKDH